MKININVSARFPTQKTPEEYKHRSICEKARDYMMVCESDTESEYHWKYLKALYNKLHQLKCLPEEYIDLMGELEAFMSKYGIYDSGNDMAEMTAENMFKYREGA